MTKQNLTPEGVAAKLNELYALPDVNLTFEFAAIEVNFPQWIMAHFTIAESQILYLNRLNNFALNYFGQQCKTALLCRLPIYLIDNTSSDHHQNKYLSLINNLIVMTTDNGGMKIEGSLSFQISYE